MAISREKLKQEMESSGYSKLMESIKTPLPAKGTIHGMAQSDRQDWFRRYAYHPRTDGFWDFDSKLLLDRKSFDAIYRHVECYSVFSDSSKPKRCSAGYFYDEHRDAMSGKMVTGVTYAPGAGDLVDIDGSQHGNSWRDARPHKKGGKPVPEEKIKVWADHLRRMVPDPADRQHLLCWMAFKVQNSAVKINHGILHCGHPGSGKDSLYAPFLYAVGGVGKANISVVRNDDLRSTWNYSYISEVMVLNELRVAGSLDSDRKATENVLKPVLAAPPEILVVNKKYEHPVPVLNRMSVLAFSNETVPLILPANDRRWWVQWSTAKPMSIDEAVRLWTWYEKEGGFDLVARWLANYPIPDSWHPAAPPPMTLAKSTMIKAGQSTAESSIEQAIEQRSGIFESGVIGGPWIDFLDQICTDLHLPRTQVRPALLFALLSLAGWQDMGKVNSKKHTNFRHMWIHPDVFESLGRNRSSARGLLEQAEIHYVLAKKNPAINSDAGLTPVEGGREESFNGYIRPVETQVNLDGLERIKRPGHEAASDDDADGEEGEPLPD